MKMKSVDMYRVKISHHQNPMFVAAKSIEQAIESVKDTVGPVEARTLKITSVTYSGTVWIP